MPGKLLEVVSDLAHRHLSGHVSVGPVTIYGENAMHWSVNVWTRRWGYICFRLPLPSMGRWWPLYFYLSPNATPWASTLFLGDTNYGVAETRATQVSALVRWALWGHGYDVEHCDPQKLSEAIARFSISCWRTESAESAEVSR